MQKIFKNTYKGKRVLVTGDTGFKGSWLSLWLNALGAEVIGYALEPPTKPSLFKALQLDKRINHITADIRNSKTLKGVFDKYKPEIVFHLAAQSLVTESYKKPKLTFETNIMGLVNIFEAVKEAKCTRVLINITSDKCYKDHGLISGCKETDPMGGSDPYSASKGCSELVTTAYRESFFNPKDYGKTHRTAVASARAGNVIGGGDWAKDRILPDCIKSLASHKAIPIRNPSSIRPWQYVLEPIAGYLWLGALMWNDGVAFCEGWNFGPRDEHVLTVRELVEEVVKIWGSGEYKISRSNNVPEARILRLDIKKVQASLKWRPVYYCCKALEHTVVWYKSYYTMGNNMNVASINAIEEYILDARKRNIPWSKE